LINIGEPATGKSMLGSLICRFTDHVWDPEDLNEITGHMDVGDEAILRCRRCNTIVVSIEKLRDGNIRWNAHYDGAKLYDLTDEYKKERGMKDEIDKFREDNK